MTSKKIICQQCDSSVPTEAAFMHSCGKIWRPFSDLRNKCPHCKKEEKIIECPFCKFPNSYDSWINQFEILKQKAIQREEYLKNRIGFDWLEKIIDNSLEKMKSKGLMETCLLYTSPSPRDQRGSRMPSSA